MSWLVTSCTGLLLLGARSAVSEPWSAPLMDTFWKMAWPSTETAAARRDERTENFMVGGSLVVWVVERCGCWSGGGDKDKPSGGVFEMEDQAGYLYTRRVSHPSNPQ